MTLFPKLRTNGLAAIVLLLTSVPQARASDNQGNVKAVIIFNILRFASFPNTHHVLRLCTRDSEAIARNLMALNGRSLGQRQLDVVFVSSWNDNMDSCDVIYAGSTAAEALPRLRRGQITIGDGPSFIDHDGTVGLIKFGGQTRFAINAHAARQVGVRFSSQLMRLAARVIN